MASCGTLRLAPPFDPFAFEVVSCPAPSEAVAGEQMTQPVTVENRNEQDGSVPVRLQARPPGVAGNSENVTLAETTAVVPAGSQKTVEMTYTAPSQSGDWTLLATTSEASRANSQSVLSAAPVTEAVADRTTKGTLATAAAGLGVIGARRLLGGY